MHGRARGFTLVELMSVLLIAGILLAAGVPALQDFSAEQQLIGAGNAFFHGIGMTRAQALRHGRRSSMTPADGRDWASGWTIDTGDGRPVLSHPPLPRGISVAYTKGGDTLGYQPGGQPVTRGSWHFSSGGKTRVVVINFLGRVRICNPAVDSGCEAG
jgi:type IV fimbrial biogenesis protein FimT